jgi:hypothetical protein
MALIQFCQQTLTAFANSKEQLDGAAELFAAKLREMANAVSLHEPEKH